MKNSTIVGGSILLLVASGGACAVVGNGVGAFWMIATAGTVAVIARVVQNEIK